MLGTITAARKPAGSDAEGTRRDRHVHTFEALLAHYGIPALFLTITLETLGAPLPGESAIIVASGAAARGELCDLRASPSPPSSRRSSATTSAT